MIFFFFSSRRRHTRWNCDWSSDVCSSDLPWWRKHSMEARSSTALSAVIARETERLAVGWGIISPFTRHPIQIAMEARVTQEAAGPGRFYLGLGVSKIFMRHAGIGEGARPVAAMREAAQIIRGVLGGEELD